MIAFNFKWPGVYLSGNAVIAAPSEESARALLATKLNPEKMAEVECDGEIDLDPRIASMPYFNDGDY